PQAQPEVVILPQGLIITPRSLDVKNTNNAGNLKPANDLTSVLNNLVGSDTEAGKSTTPVAGLSHGTNKDDFENLLKEFSGKNGKSDFVFDIGKADTSNAAAPSIKPGLS